MQLKPCAKCISLRAKFVRWLGIILGVMKPIEEKKMEQPQQTGFTQDQIAAIIGTKELERIDLQRQLQQWQALWSNLEAVQARAAELSKPQSKLREV